MSEAAIIHADCDGVIQVWGGDAQSLFGYSPQDALGKTLDILVPEPYREAHWRGFRAAVERRATSQDEPFVLPILCKDGQTRPFAGRLFFLRDAYDRAVGAMAIFAKDDPAAAAKDLYRL
jgi:PAS domain S-box-containing protein